jgi:2-polyprenyl-3-methyl-5-hydroxy-6-metoxy-1,4-benzoquinol methylase
MKEVSIACDYLSQWNSILLDMEKSEYSDFKNKIFRTRSRHAVAFSLPFILSARPNLSNLTCLEVGCGFGSKSLPLSLIVKEYIGVDIDAEQIERANQLKKAIRSSANFLVLSADSLASLVKEVQPDIVILYAVLEHLTIKERLVLLESLWEELPNEAIIYIGETPNRLNHIDFHSSQLPYFTMVPPELGERIYTMSRRTEWINRVNQEATVNLGLHRRGQAVSFHDFWAVFGNKMDDINSLIVADGFSSHKLNWKSWKLCETHFLEQFNYLRTSKNKMYNYNIHSTFAKSMLNFILKKPQDKKNKVLEVGDVFLKLPNEQTEGQDWLGNSTANLKNGLEIWLKLTPKKAKLGILKYTFKGEIELFDELKQSWIVLNSGEYANQEYISLCGDHIFFELPLQKTYKIRSDESIKTIGILVGM